jgi:hypothetical protein
MTMGIMQNARHLCQSLRPQDTMNGRASCVLDGQRSSGKQKKAAIKIGLELPVESAFDHFGPANLP